jgi:hypothetical protein
MTTTPEPPRRSRFDGLPQDVREAMELAFVHAVADALEREAAALTIALDDPARDAGHTGRREVLSHGAVTTL